MLIPLENYGVSSKTGFVPEKGSQPLPRAFEAWERLVKALPSKLANGTFPEDLVSLPPFSLNDLCHEHQWQRAYIVLGFLVHAHVHACQQNTVPALLSEPFLAVCDHLGLEPVLSYAGLCTYNWSQSDDPELLHGLKAEITFTGTLDEVAFYLVPIIVELVGGRLPALLMNDLAAAEKGDWDVVTRDLEECSNTFVKMTNALSQLSLCNPHTFYHQIRPNMAGLDIDFERVNGDKTRIKVVGGSAVQSAYFPFIDSVLGIYHDSQIMTNMRQLMPRGHRLLLEKMSQQPSLLQLMDANNAVPSARDALVECRQQLQKWRSKHIAVVTRYVVLPAQAAARRDNKELVEAAGTAGSSPLPFLKEIRDETMLRKG